MRHVTSKVIQYSFVAFILAAPLSGDVPQYGVFEQSLNWNSAPYSNVWEQVSVAVTVRAPSGASTAIGGFYYDTNIWKFRYAPSELGTYSWTAIVNDTLGTTPASFSGTFQSVASSNPGFVRRSPTNAFRWVTSDGQPFYPMGFTDCVFRRNANGLRPFEVPTDIIRFFVDGPGNGAADSPTYFGIFGASKFNVFRWGPDNCAVAMYSTISPAGNVYLDIQARRIDDMMPAARRNGVRIYQVLFGPNPPFPNYSTGDQLSAIERYVKYMIDRYGAYVDFWELMNEATVDLVWYSEIIAFIRANDPYQHPISTSMPQAIRPDIDIMSPHWYQTESEFDSEIVTATNFYSWKYYGKPVIVGEQGNVTANWDPGSALRMRLRSWTAFFWEGSLLFWNTAELKPSTTTPGAPANIYLGPTERSYINVLQTFAAGFDSQATQAALAVSNPGVVRGYALSGPRQFAAYLHAFRDHTNSTTGITVSVNPQAAGTAVWIDPSTGNTLLTQGISAGAQTLAVPTFTTDIALKTVTGSLPAQQVTLSSIALNPTAVIAGQPSTGTVTLSGPAPAGGASISLTSQLPCCLTPPTSIVVGAGQTSAQFTINTVSNGAPYSGLITASYSGVNQSATLSVQQPQVGQNPLAAISSLVLSPTTVAPGQTSIGTVTLTGPAPAGGASIALAGQHPCCLVPPSNVIVPAGQSSAQFTINTAWAGQPFAGWISAVYNGVSLSATLSVQMNAPPLNPVVASSLVSLVLSPTTVAHGQTSIGTVTLTGPAPAGGASIALAGQHPCCLVPPSNVIVPAGQSSAQFTINTAWAGQPFAGWISAAYNGVRLSATLSVQ